VPQAMCGVRLYSGGFSHLDGGRDQLKRPLQDQGENKRRNEQDYG
jgi:hypothetical protein